MTARPARLYANQMVSAYLRDHFVLHWSSERAVPRAAIDFGDGRVIETTIAGNSAHYVLDASGDPIDVVPGLYGPAAFVEALEPARAFAGALAGVDGDDRCPRSTPGSTVSCSAPRRPTRGSAWARPACLPVCRPTACG